VAPFSLDEKRAATFMMRQTPLKFGASSSEERITGISTKRRLPMLTLTHCR